MWIQYIYICSVTNIMFVTQLFVETHQQNVCMYVIIQITTYQDEVTYTLTQWCSCGGVSVSEFTKDCLNSIA